MEMLISYGTYNQNRKSASKQATAVMIKKLFAGLFKAPRYSGPLNESGIFACLSLSRLPRSFASSHCLTTWNRLKDVRSRIQEKKSYRVAFNRI